MRNNAFNRHIKNLVDRTENVMRAPLSNCRETLFERGLRGASLLYGAVAAYRRNLYRAGKCCVRKLPVPVISVGNLAVGGTGKTPMTIYLARLLQAQNFHPAIISRGYGGTAEKNGAIVSDGICVLADSVQAGDEPLMMARELKQTPILVGQNRYQSGLTAIEKFGCNVVILDDGFQHMNLHRDLNIVLLDAKAPLGNGFTLPRGILREPVSALMDAHAVVFTRSDLTKHPIPTAIAPIVKALPHFNAGLSAYLHDAAHCSDPSPPTLADLNGKRVCLFSAIARNDDFQKTISRLGARIYHHAKFGDHHRYCRAELDHIIDTAIQTGSELLLTTEKDFARLKAPCRWPLPFAVIGVKMTFPNAGFDHFVLQSMRTIVPAAFL